MIVFILIQALIYLACGLLLWLILRLVAPSGTTMPLSRLVICIVVLAVLLNLSRRFLLPIIGAWFFVVDIIGTIFAVKLFFRISSLRSIVVALIFWTIVSTASLFFTTRPAEKGGPPNRVGGRIALPPPTPPSSAEAIGGQVRLR